MAMDNKLSKRASDMMEIGMVRNFKHSSYVGDIPPILDFNVPFIEVQLRDDDEWNAFCERLRTIKKERLDQLKGPFSGLSENLKIQKVVMDLYEMILSETNFPFMKNKEMFSLAKYIVDNYDKKPENKDDEGQV